VVDSTIRIESAESYLTEDEGHLKLTVAEMKHAVVHVLDGETKLIALFNREIDAIKFVTYMTLH
jgi:hypothetical protein